MSSEQILRALLQFDISLLEKVLSVALPNACCITCAVHALLQRFNLPYIILSLVLGWQTHQYRSLSLGVGRRTRPIDVQDCRWFVAIESVAIGASSGDVPACKSGLSALVKSRAIIRVLICIVSASNALSVRDVLHAQFFEATVCCNTTIQHNRVWLQTNDENSTPTRSGFKNSFSRQKRSAVDKFSRTN